MHIFMINATNTVPDKGGIASYTHELASHLREEVQHVTVLTYPLHEGLPPKDHTLKYSQVRLRSFDFYTVSAPSQKRLSPSNVGKIQKLTAKASFYQQAYRRMAVMAFETCRLVIKHRPASPDRATVLWAITWLPEGFVAALTSMLLRIPYVVTAHGKEVILRPNRVSGATYRWVLGHASRIFAVSHHTADMLYRSGVPSQRVSVIHNGVKADDFSDTSEEEGCAKAVIERYGLHGKKTMVTIARLVERKGHENVLQGLRGLREVLPELRYLIVGDGPLMGRLTELVSQWSLEDVVLFTGEVAEHEKLGILKACDLFIMPNRDIPLPNGLDTEGFGIAFLEANACGKPVIGGNAGGAREAIADGRTGLLVNPEDPIAIRDAILRILSDDGLARSMGEAGRKRVLEHFQWATIAKAYLAELKTL